MHCRLAQQYTTLLGFLRRSQGTSTKIVTFYKVFYSMSFRNKVKLDQSTGKILYTFPNFVIRKPNIVSRLSLFILQSNANNTTDNRAISITGIIWRNTPTSHKDFMTRIHDHR